MFVGKAPTIRRNCGVAIAALTLIVTGCAPSETEGRHRRGIRRIPTGPTYC